MFVMLHIPEALRHTLMPWTPTWVSQEKIYSISLKFCIDIFYYVAYQAYVDAMDFNLGKPGKDK